MTAARPLPTIIEPTGKDERRLTMVRDLKVGQIILGTGPSGRFETGPEKFLRRTKAPEHSVRTQAYRVHTDKGERILYGDAYLEIAR